MLICPHAAAVQWNMTEKQRTDSCCTKSGKASAGQRGRRAKRNKSQLNQLWAVLRSPYIHSRSNSYMLRIDKWIGRWQFVTLRIVTETYLSSKDYGYFATFQRRLFPVSDPTQWIDCFDNLSWNRSKKVPNGIQIIFRARERKHWNFQRMLQGWWWIDCGQIQKKKIQKKNLRCISSLSTFFFSSSRLPEHCSVTNANHRWLESDQVKIWCQSKYQPIIYQKSPIKYHGLFTMEPIIHQCLLKSIQ